MIWKRWSRCGSNRKDASLLQGQEIPERVRYLGLSHDKSQGMRLAQIQLLKRSHNTRVKFQKKRPNTPAKRGITTKSKNSKKSNKKSNKKLEKDSKKLLLKRTRITVLNSQKSTMVKLQLMARLLSRLLATMARSNESMLLERRKLFSIMVWNGKVSLTATPSFTLIIKTSSRPSLTKKSHTTSQRQKLLRLLLSMDCKCLSLLTTRSKNISQMGLRK